MAVLGQLTSIFFVVIRSCNRIRAWLIAVAWLVLSLGASPVSAQSISREYQLKAVLLYNLTQFVEWPASAFGSGDAPLVIGVLGENPFGNLLEEAVRNERSNNRRIVVRRFTSVEQIKECAMLFVCAARQKEFAGILTQLKGRPILTVADADGFIRNDGMIRFSQNADNKIRLKINLEAAKSRGLTISAKLLRVAEIVTPKDD